MAKTQLSFTAHNYGTICFLVVSYRSMQTIRRTSIWQKSIVFIISKRFWKNIFYTSTNLMTRMTLSIFESWLYSIIIYYLFWLLSELLSPRDKHCCEKNNCWKIVKQGMGGIPSLPPPGPFFFFLAGQCTWRLRVSYPILYNSSLCRLVHE